MFVNILAGAELQKTTSACASKTFTYKLVNLFAGYIPDKGFALPSTCTLDTLAEGKGCLMKFPLSKENDSFINVAMDKCDAKMMRPYVSVTCSGPLCSRLAMPCSTNADCGGSLQCTSPGITKDAIRGADKDIRSVMDSLDMFDKDADKPECLAAGVTADENGADIIGSFMSFFRSFYDGKVWDARKGDASFAVCGGNLINPDSIEENFVDPVDCSSEDSRVTCNGLQAWDGTLADGTNALSETLKQGTGTHSNMDRCAQRSGALRGIMDISCWGKVGFNLGKRMSMYMSMKHMPKLLEWYSTTMKKVQDCRGSGVAYTLPYYMANFAPWMPNAMMQRLTTDAGGQRNLISEEKVGVSKPLMTTMNDMTDDVGGVLVR